VALLIAVWVAWPIALQEYLPQDLVTQRILEDQNMKGRLALDQFALTMVPRYPLGLGQTLMSPIYHAEAYLYGIPIARGMAPTVHNGFLSGFVRFGWLGGLAFAGLLLGSCWFFVRHASLQQKVSWGPAIFAITAVLYNLTEDFAQFQGQPWMVFAILMGYYATLYPCAAKGTLTPVRPVAHDGGF
jgi:hypothetical protein